MNPECPKCSGCDTIQINDQQAECLDCGQVFSHLAPELEEAA